MINLLKVQNGIVGARPCSVCKKDTYYISTDRLVPVCKECAKSVGDISKLPTLQKYCKHTPQLRKLAGTV